MIAGDNAGQPFELLFDQKGDFQAVRAAEDWCKQRGISVGSSERGRPTGLLVGEFAISKWHNMDAGERAALDGTLEGDMRSGPVRLRMKRAAYDRLTALFEAQP